MKNVYLPKQTICARRVGWISTGLLLMFIIVLFSGFVRLQMIQSSLDDRFLRMHSGSSNLPAHRGSILGRDGDDSVPLAMSSDVYHITLVPYLLQKKNKTDEQYERQAQSLASVLEIDSNNLLQKMKSDDRFMYLKKNVPAWLADHIEALKIPGVRKEYISKRYYTDPMNFSHVVGYTDGEGIGRAGIEYAEHKKLEATDGEVRYVKTVGKGVVSELQHLPAVPGNNIYLTLDRRIQHVAYSALAQAAHRHSAKSASAMIMDVRNGDILALANYPSYNLNDKGTMNNSNQINHALADRVEPGSTVKPFVVALALEQHLTQPQEVFATKRPLQIGKLRVFDKHVREDLDVSGIIRKSSNVGVVQLAQRVGAGQLETFYRQLGFGGGKVLNFIEETNGILRPHSEWRNTDFATHSYGYGFSLTLPQLLRAYSVFATDGVLVSPRLWRNVPVEAGKQLLSPKTARTVRGMLETVVSKEGTAVAASIDGYRVAGKTGTVGKWTNGKFDLDRRRVFFVGMVPVSQPRYLAVVMLDEPTKNGDSGGSAAAPVFSQIMQNVLLYGAVRPDALTVEQQPAEQAI